MISNETIRKLLESKMSSDIKIGMEFLFIKYPEVKTKFTIRNPTSNSFRAISRTDLENIIGKLNIATFITGYIHPEDYE